MGQIRVETAQVEVGDSTAVVLNVDNLIDVCGITKEYRNRTEIRIKNMDSTETLFVGDENVTADNGYPIGPGESEKFQLPNGVDIYGIVSSGIIDVGLLEILR